MIPDIMALASPGERAECRREAPRTSTLGHEGVRGLRALGVRDLSYRLAFIANSLQVVLTAVFVVISLKRNIACTMHHVISLSWIRFWMAGETVTSGIRRRMLTKLTAKCSLSVI